VAILDLVREQASLGATVIYTTHYMEEAEKLCDELAIIDHGDIIAIGTLPELRAMLGERDIVRVTGRFDPRTTAGLLARFNDLELVHAEEDTLTIAIPEASKQLSDIIKTLSHGNFEVRETTLTQPSLESLFIRLTGKELRE
jgi:ABC-2 type transport system ATP-binding protein